MTTRPFEYFWDRIRYTQTRLSSQAQIRRKKDAWEPGDIACCELSIERIFYRALEDNGIKLKEWEKGGSSSQPKRYCIVNRRIETGSYEVFVLTTFSGAKSFGQMGELGRYFGLPMGDTQWISSTPGLMTIPHIWFGRTFPSFAFAIPCITKVETAMLRYHARLAPGELERLQRYAEGKRKAMLRDEQHLRKTTKTSHRVLYRSEKALPATYDDHVQFRPLSSEEDDHLREEQLEHLYFPEPYHSKLTRSIMKRQRIRVPRHSDDITWIARHSSNDILNGTSFIPSIRFRPGPLPKPHYAACLRTSLEQVARVLRRL
ncbi:hypothetical protein M413DRAFT_438564 [Hebeloma cylindrosporum]|uniref:Uncharacterized protein n=1 Tax=Hebeloma cylindrosporum TaxID=76867 RepID=A0A0C3CL01_HEBCY|nr:hypothetical protein M413DRAFT_438564 [Hebeloma cylindrosporum h7]